jgi:hypothetical protein
LLFAISGVLPREEAIRQIKHYGAIYGRGSLAPALPPSDATTRDVTCAR